jgi:predicted P-loop ATPase
MRLERRIDLGALRAARLQLWGEAAAADTAGESLVLDEALWGDAAVVQEARRVRDPWEEALARLAPVGANDSVLAGVGMVGFGIVQVVGDEWRVATKDIFQITLGMSAHMLDDRHTKRLANAMRALGWTKGVMRFESGAVRGYHRKADGA